MAINFSVCHQKVPGLLIPATPDWEIQAGESTALPWPRRWPSCSHHPECHTCACNPATATTHRGGLLLVEWPWKLPPHHPTVSGQTCFGKQHLIHFAWLPFPATGMAEGRCTHRSHNHWRAREELKSTITDQLQPPGSEYKSRGLGLVSSPLPGLLPKPKSHVIPLP